LNSIPSALTIVNETDVRGKALLALIVQYISFANGFYGFKSLGTNLDIQFPVVFVEPRSQDIRMLGTAKFHIKITYAIYWYVRDNDPTDIVTLSTFIGEALTKLFSNNALGDLQSANPPSNKFKQYANPSGGYYWLDNDMSEMRWTVNYLDPTASGVRYERAGRMMLQIEDVILK